MIVNKILEYYSNKEKDREFSTDVFRASSSGKCVRALWYQMNGYTREAMTGRALMVFRMGDLVEQDIVDVMKKLNLIHGEQMYLQIKVTDNCWLNGHIDGFIIDKGSIIPIDVKSTSSFGYDKAVKGIVDDSYLAQAHCYMRALEVTKFIFLYYKKETSHIVEVPITWDQKIWDLIVKRYTALNKETEPRREKLTINKDRCLGYPCSYCGYLKHCQANMYDITFDSKDKPKIKLKKEFDKWLGE